MRIEMWRQLENTERGLVLTGIYHDWKSLLGLIYIHTELRDYTLEVSTFFDRHIGSHGEQVVQVKFLLPPVVLKFKNASYTFSRDKYPEIEYVRVMSERRFKVDGIVLTESQVQRAYEALRKREGA